MRQLFNCIILNKQNTVLNSQHCEMQEFCVTNCKYIVYYNIMLRSGALVPKSFSTSDIIIRSLFLTIVIPQ